MTGQGRPWREREGVRCRSGRAARCVAAVCALLASSLVAASDGAQRELAVCADPSNLPYSNERQEGFENRIASLIASDLKATLRYTWNMQRRSFLRRTLNAGVCDLVIGLPTGLQGVAESRPYYASSYVFVTSRQRGLHLTGFDDPALRTLKIGLQAVGAEGSNTPPASALARRGITDHITGYPMWGDEDDETPQGRIVDAVASGEIDVAIVWGPFAGYFAQRHKDKLLITPTDGDPKQPDLAFRYEMALGVRRGDEVFLGELQQVLDRRQPEIKAILRDYGIPLADTAAPTGVRTSGLIGLVTDRMGK